MMEQFFKDLYFSFVGYGVVFIVLLLLWGVVVVMQFTDRKLQNFGKKKVKLADEHQNIDYTTLVLLSATVATYFKGGAYIKRVRVLPSNIRSEAWSAQGRTSVQSSHAVKK